MNEIVLNHPLITHKLGILRDIHTGTKEFRELITEISTLLCYEATKDAKLEKTIIEIHKVQRRIYARKRIFSEQKDRR